MERQTHRSKERSREQRAPPRHPEPHGSRRRSPLVLAAAAAAVLAAVGGGAYWATTASGGADARGGSAATRHPPRGERDGGGAAGGHRPGEPDPNGVATGRGEAARRARHGLRLPAARQVSGADVTGSRGPSGSTGRPRRRAAPGRWGHRRTARGPAQVNQKAPGTWTYPGSAGRRARDRWPKRQDVSDAHHVRPAPDHRGAAPDRRCAGRRARRRRRRRRAARPSSRRSARTTPSSTRRRTGSVRVVNADPKVDGLPTYGWTTGIQVGPDGQVVGGSGQLKTPDKGATYPVIGADQTLAQLNSSGQRPDDGSAAAPGRAAETAAAPRARSAPCEPATTRREAADGDGPPSGSPRTPWTGGRPRAVVAVRGEAGRGPRALHGHAPGGGPRVPAAPDADRPSQTPDGRPRRRRRPGHGARPIAVQRGRADGDA